MFKHLNSINKCEIFVCIIKKKKEKIEILNNFIIN